ncbi:unnamed protein product, partial [Scytosiphon promiscuus]
RVFRLALAAVAAAAAALDRRYRHLPGRRRARDGPRWERRRGWRRRLEEEEQLRVPRTGVVVRKHLDGGTRLPPSPVPRRALGGVRRVAGPAGVARRDVAAGLRGRGDETGRRWEGERDGDGDGDGGQDVFLVVFVVHLEGVRGCGGMPLQVSGPVMFRAWDPSYWLGFPGLRCALLPRTSGRRSDGARRRR